MGFSFNIEKSTEKSHLRPPDFAFASTRQKSHWKTHMEDQVFLSGSAGHGFEEFWVTGLLRLQGDPPEDRVSWVSGPGSAGVRPSSGHRWPMEDRPPISVSPSLPISRSYSLIFLSQFHSILSLCFISHSLDLISLSISLSPCHLSVSRSLCVWATWSTWKKEEEERSEEK
jgi:hypothetical protein